MNIRRLRQKALKAIMKLKIKHEKQNTPSGGLRGFFGNKKAVVIAAGLIVVAILAAVLLLSGVFRAPTPEEPIVPPQPQTDPVTPNVDEDFAPFTSAELKAAYESNSDVVGWLSLSACDIDNPVFQATDNDFYLRKNEAGESDIWGCYFLDYINVSDGNQLFDKVSIIYGHSLDDYADSERFSKLKKYKDPVFAKANPTVTFSLLNKELKYEIFAAVNIPISIDYIDPNPDDVKYRQTLDYMLNNSFVDFGVKPATDDKILVLSTCTSDDSVRFVIAARLIEG